MLSVSLTDYMLKSFQHFDTFIDELRWEETDSLKCNKLTELKLDEDEWNRVTNFIYLLSVCISFEVFDCSFNFDGQHADNAQQSFSSE